MKKKVLVFAAMFLAVFGLVFAPASTAHAKGINLNRLNGKYYTVREHTSLTLSGKKVHINGFLDGYGNQADAGKVNRSFRLAKNVKYNYGMEVNETVTNHRCSRSTFISRLKKDYSSVNVTFKKGKVTNLKIVYD